MNRSLAAFVSVLCVGLLAVALIFLFKERFSAGDAQPAYSSLRSDPLGTMIFYESLERIPGLKVSRDFTSAGHLPPPQDTTYLHLAGVRSHWLMMPEETVQEIERFVLNGGRLVVLFAPNYFRDFDSDEEAKEKKAGKDEKKKDANDTKAEKGDEKKDTKAERDKKKHPPRRLTTDEDDEFDWVDVTKRWGFEFDVDPRKEKDPPAASDVAQRAGSDPVPESLKWHNTSVFKNLDSSWHVVYRSHDKPVVAVKTMGHGTMVLATDSYFVSNEAMPIDRHADLLAWLIGPNHKVIFDEAHLGIVDRSGLASLARKYRLHGAIAALCVLALLFVWKNSVSLLPARKVRTPQLHVPGKDSSTGFTSLLRRNIPPASLLDTCVAEWNKTPTGNPRRVEQNRAAVAKILEQEKARPPREQDPVKTYQAIAATLSNRKSAVPPASS